MFLKLAHTKLDIFQSSKALAKECYSITKQFPAEEKFALTQQIRRAALSVHLNIAEGASRKSETERKRFFEVAKGSVIEIDTAFDIACELRYCVPERLTDLGAAIVKTFKMLSGMIGK